MGNHHDDHDHRHADGGHGQDQGQHGDGGPNTEFLDLEPGKVLYAEAEQITREAYRELLKDAAKQRLQERWGARIEAIAQLAVDELLADVEASLEIVARIEQRNHGRRRVDERVAEILAHTHERAKDDD